MEMIVKNFENKEVGKVDLKATIFEVPLRTDILTRMVNWQLAKRRSGTHKTKGVSDISGTTRKPYRQKGTGRARQGSLRSPQFRGGAVIFGPVVRDHGYDLPKKVRRLALRVALSHKAAQGALLIVDDLSIGSAKTKDFIARIQDLGIHSALMIGGSVLQSDFVCAASNVPEIDVLPQQGINVYDILRRKMLVLSKEALAYLENRLT